MLEPKFNIGQKVYFIGAKVDPDALKVGNQIAAEKVGVFGGSIEGIYITAEAIGYTLSEISGGFVAEPLLFASKVEAEKAMEENTGYAVPIGEEEEDEDNV